jgi:hypothetical protein
MEFKIYNLCFNRLLFNRRGGWEFDLHFVNPAFIFIQCQISECFDNLDIPSASLPHKEYENLKKLIGDRIKAYVEKCPKEI